MRKAIGSRHFARTLICFFTLLCLTFSFLSCIDLGEFEGNSSDLFSDVAGYGSYYASFGRVKTISAAGEYDYDVASSLFNERTVKKLGWNAGDGDEEVTCREYVYVAIPVRRDINIDDLALYVKAEEILSVQTPGQGEEAPAPVQSDAGVLRISAFVLGDISEMPDKVRFPGDPLDEEIEVPDAETGETAKETVEIEYDDPAAETAVASTTATVKKNEWTSFMLSSWVTEEGGSSKISLKDGNVLLLRFENNSGWSEDGLPQCSFQFLNLLVRAVK